MERRGKEMNIPHCTRHQKIYICGKWQDENDAVIQATMRYHQDEIEYEERKCEKCFEEMIPA